VRDEVADTTIVHTEGRAGDLRGTLVDSARADRELGWRAQTPLREGVRRYAAWLAEQEGGAVVAPRVPAPAVATGRRRSLQSLVVAGARNPAAAGIVGLIAVASAAATAVVGAREEAPAADFTLLGLALLMPLWALTTVEWSPELRRLQGAVSGVIAAIGVLVLAILSSTTSAAGLPHRSLFAVVVVSAALTGALRLVPRRLSESHF
jgi:hypothetical protein